MASPSLPHRLGKNGKVRSHLFRDKVHLNKSGYAIWAGKMAPPLKTMMK